MHENGRNENELSILKKREERGDMKEEIKVKMNAVVLERPCSADDLRVSKVPMPCVKEGWVLIRIKAFGINRAEILTRNGHSPSVRLPRIIGIECAGIVEDPSDSGFRKGDTVFSMMNGMGREFDGSYAEYVLVPAGQVYRIDSGTFASLTEGHEELRKGDMLSAYDMDKVDDEMLKWAKVAAYLEMFYTAYGSLFRSLKLKAEETLLIRGGTGSVALASLQLAKALKIKVAVTTRNALKEEFLKEKGADVVIIDDGLFEERIKEQFPHGVDKVLELVGASTLKSSLNSVRQGGIVCMTGCLGGWTLKDFEPLDDIISETYLTSFNSTFINKDILEGMLSFIIRNKISPCISKIFSLCRISEAHKYIESGISMGKVIVMNDIS